MPFRWPNGSRRWGRPSTKPTATLARPGRVSGLPCTLTLCDCRTRGRATGRCSSSMSDLFHVRVPLSFVRDVFEVIAATPQHTYQVLTKRSARLPKIAGRLEWPPNLWLGVSVENTTTLPRVDHLR